MELTFEQWERLESMAAYAINNTAGDFPEDQAILDDIRVRLTLARSYGYRPTSEHQLRREESD